MKRVVGFIVATVALILMGLGVVLAVNKVYSLAIPFLLAAGVCFVWIRWNAWIRGKGMERNRKRMKAWVGQAFLYLLLAAAALGCIHYLALGMAAVVAETCILEPIRPSARGANLVRLTNHLCLRLGYWGYAIFNIFGPSLLMGSAVVLMYRRREKVVQALVGSD